MWVSLTFVGSTSFSHEVNPSFMGPNPYESNIIYNSYIKYFFFFFFCNFILCMRFKLQTCPKENTKFNNFQMKCPYTKGQNFVVWTSLFLTVCQRLWKPIRPKRAFWIITIFLSNNPFNIYKSISWNFVEASNITMHEHVGNWK